MGWRWSLNMNATNKLQFQNMCVIAGWIYRGVFGHPVPQDVQHSVGRSPPDHKLLVTISLISWEPCRKRHDQWILHSCFVTNRETGALWGTFKPKI